MKTQDYFFRSSTLHSGLILFCNITTQTHGVSVLLPLRHPCAVCIHLMLWTETSWEPNRWRLYFTMLCVNKDSIAMVTASFLLLCSDETQDYSSNDSHSKTESGRWRRISTRRHRAVWHEGFLRWHHKGSLLAGDRFPRQKSLFIHMHKNSLTNPQDVNIWPCF